MTRAGTGTDRAGARVGQEQDKVRAGAGQGRAQTGLGRKALDNAKDNALGNTGHNTLQDKAKGMIDCEIERRAGQSGRQNREKEGIPR